LSHHAAHGRDQEHGAHAGHADVYRRRFWINLILAIPVVIYSETVQDWFGYKAPQFPGDACCHPCWAR
jgi:Cu2+-exporting ATPase